MSIRTTILCSVAAVVVSAAAGTAATAQSANYDSRYGNGPQIHADGNATDRPAQSTGGQRHH